MKKENVAKLALVLVLLALAFQLTFVLSNAVGKGDYIYEQSKAVLGITW